MDTPSPILNPDARSPYQRRRKKPWKYSGLLDSLSAARRAGNHDEGDRLARQHSAQHGLRWCHCEVGEVDW